MFRFSNSLSTALKFSLSPQTTNECKFLGQASLVRVEVTVLSLFCDVVYALPNRPMIVDNFSVLGDGRS